MSSERWKRRHEVGTRNLVDGIEYAASFVVSRMAIWRSSPPARGSADVEAIGSSWVIDILQKGGGVGWRDLRLKLKKKVRPRDTFPVRPFFRGVETNASTRRSRRGKAIRKNQ